jgi:DNA-binding Lrp family transcriptional regulator
MPKARIIHDSDARILVALNSDPRATVVALAAATGLSRNTVHARLAAMEADGRLRPPELRIDPAALGYPLGAVILVRVRQRSLDRVASELSRIPQVVEVMGMSGEDDLHVRVVAADADDLYRIAGQVLAIDGVERTETGLVMRRLVPYRVTPLLHRIIDGNSVG